MKHDGPRRCAAVVLCLGGALLALFLLELLNLVNLTDAFGLFGQPERNPLLFTADQGPYFKAALHHAIYGGYRTTAYVVGGQLFSPPLLAIEATSWLLRFCDIRAFYGILQLATLAALFLLLFAILRQMRWGPVQSFCIALFVLANYHLWFQDFGAISYPLPYAETLAREHFSLAVLREHFFALARHVVFACGKIVRLLGHEQPYIAPFKTICRYTSLSCDLVPFLAAYACLLRYVDGRRKTYFYAACVLQIIVYFTNNFAWQTLFCAVACAVFADFMEKNLTVRQVAAYMLTALPAFYTALRMLSDLPQDVLVKSGVLSSRIPSLTYSVLPLCFAACAAIAWKKSSSAAEKREKRFAFALAVACLLLVNQNVVTGVDFQLYHITWYTTLVAILWLLRFLARGASVLLVPKVPVRLLAAAGYAIVLLSVARTGFAIVKHQLDLPPPTAEQTAQAADFHKARTALTDLALAARDPGLSYFLLDAYAIDIPLESGTPLLHIVSNTAPIFSSLAVPTPQMAKAVIVGMLLGESAGLGDAELRTLYDHYADKILFYFFDTPPSRPDIVAYTSPRTGLGEAAQLRFFKDVLATLIPEDITDLLAVRTDFRYILARPGRDFAGARLDSVTPLTPHLTLYTLNPSNYAHALAQFVPRLKARFDAWN